MHWQWITIVICFKQCWPSYNGIKTWCSDQKPGWAMVCRHIARRMNSPRPQNSVKTDKIWEIELNIKIGSQLSQWRILPHPWMTILCYSYKASSQVQSFRSDLLMELTISFCECMVPDTIFISTLYHLIMFIITTITMINHQSSPHHKHEESEQQWLREGADVEQWLQHRG